VRPVAPAGYARSREVFAAWSEVYDRQPNPLLSLEERCLSEALPDVNGLEVVDIGCGTGRWLARLASLGTASLTGVDSSPEMVQLARQKLGDLAAIYVGDAKSLPLAADSADVILISFVISYLNDLPEFVREVKRIARVGARVYLSDLHPDTALACNWRRGFKVAESAIEAMTYSRSVREVIECFEDQGFKSTESLEPVFGAPEEDILRRAGKIAAYDSAAGRPAIYIHEFRLAENNRTRVAHCAASEEINLTGARVALGPDESRSVALGIANGRISFIGAVNPDRRPTSPPLLDLDGYLLLPGLINSHDHLEFGLFPNLGRGPYRNAEQWARDIHEVDSEVIGRQRKIPKDTRLWWGAIRNLLCGVTTVCHHNPLDPALLDDNFPVRVLTDFGWAHSPAMDPDLLYKFQQTPKNVPFIVHAGEGTDIRSRDEVFELDRGRALDERTVLVHGLALDDRGIDLLNRRNATLVWCPTSNRFLFGQTHCWKSLAKVNKLVMGSDSPLTAAGDLLDEIRYAHDDLGVEANELYSMVTTRPAFVFGFDDGRGAILPEGTADLIAVRDFGASPAKAWAHLSSAAVELVLVGGRVQLISQSLIRRLPPELTFGLEPLDVDGRVCWIRAPLARLFEETQGLFPSSVALGKKKVRRVSAESI
jgi:cytosine/adenosine deaminase-related metal-dependent hydrolase/ubiquinone/menaquinone biosynthesis C-methylase UbiE